jgi:hypothetical protein
LSLLCTVKQPEGPKATRRITGRPEERLQALGCKFGTSATGC